MGIRRREAPTEGSPGRKPGGSRQPKKKSPRSGRQISYVALSGLCADSILDPRANARGYLLLALRAYL